MLQVPPELTDRVVDHLYDDSASLSACALAARALLPTVRFHRFSTTIVPVPKLSNFEELLDISPAICTFVYDLTIGVTSRGYHRSLHSSQLLSIICRVPHVKRLTFSSMKWEPHFFDVADALPMLETLTMDHCSFTKDYKDHFPRFLSSLRHLKALSLVAPDTFMVGRFGGWQWDEAAPRPPLQSLHFWGVFPRASVSLSRWLRSASPSVEVHALTTVISDYRDALAASVILQSDVLGASLTVLQLTLDSYSGILAHLEKENFTLAECSRLLDLRVELILHSMCVRSNGDLASLPFVFSRIASPHLNRVSISVTADSMSDFTGLDSECAVRNLTLATFASLTELNWHELYRVLSVNAPFSLYEMRVNGAGRAQDLQEYLAAEFPTWKNVRYIRVGSPGLGV